MTTLLRHNWTTDEALALLQAPFADLLFRAATIHRQHFDPNSVQVSTLLSIKTGGCPEDCKYCPQSAHYPTPVAKEPLMQIDEVMTAAKAAKDAGASRFCMGAAWRNLHERDVEKVCDMVSAVKGLGLETCMTLGMITGSQAERLKDAGLDYYNHNLDAAEEVYERIITTRTYQDRLDTLENVRNAGMKVCCGGIVGLGETLAERAKFLVTLANLPEHPQSVPVNRLVQVKGTPMDGTKVIDNFDFIRTIAAARIMMPESYVRLSAGRETMSDETQALCFLAGANSIFYGEKLLTTGNPDVEKDQQLFATLGITLESAAPACSHTAGDAPHHHVAA